MASNASVCTAFVNRKSAKCLSMHTDGKRLYSYSTCIAEFAPDGKLVLNVTKYSSTTSRHLTELRGVLRSCPRHHDIVEIDRVGIHSWALVGQGGYQPRQIG